MNRTELIEFVSETVGLTKTIAEKAVRAFEEGIKRSLQKEEPVILVDFGSFMIRSRAERKGRNPQTGEEIKIKAAKAVAFKAGKALKDAVKEDRKDK